MTGRGGGRKTLRGLGDGHYSREERQGAILTLTERPANFILMEKLEHRKDAEHTAKAAVRLLFPYRGEGVKTITTDNGSEFCAHEKITKALKGVVVYFADSYSSWQKGAIENANKLIKQYVPKGTDFTNMNRVLLKKIQAKINARPREKLNFSTPKCEFFKHFHQNCVINT